MNPGILFLCLVTLGQLPPASAGPQGGQDLSDDDIEMDEIVIDDMMMGVNSPGY